MMRTSSLSRHACEGGIPIFWKSNEGGRLRHHERRAFRPHLPDFASSFASTSITSAFTMISLTKSLTESRSTRPIADVRRR